MAHEQPVLPPASACVVPEIGPVAVDEMLVANRHDQMPTVTVVSGCVCCSGAVDLVAALEALADWADDRLKCLCTVPCVLPQPVLVSGLLW